MKTLTLKYLIFLGSCGLISSCDEKIEPTPTFSLSTEVSPVEGGNITIFPATGPYNQGQNVTITAQPNTNWVFKEWDGDASGNSNPLVLIMNSNKGVTAIFEKIDESGIFYIAENGITCRCENANPGEKGIIAGITYEAVDNNLIRQRRNEGVEMRKLCVSLVTDMSLLFFEKNFNEPIGNWDVSKVTNMSKMFSGNYPTLNRFNQPIGDWDVSKVTDMSSMFSDNSHFNQPIGDWDVGNVTTMTSMFASSVFNQPIANWNVSNVINMDFMFSGSQFNQSIEDWDVGRVESMSAMFSVSPFNQPIGNWNVSNVTDMNNLFGATEFNHPIGNWDVSSVKKMYYMFVISHFNQPLNNWDVSNVTDMDGMFSGSKFNQVIGNWKVGNVSTMYFMFYDNSAFNQDLSTWCVSNITSMPQDFSTKATSWVLPKPAWGTCPD